MPEQTRKINLWSLIDPYKVNPEILGGHLLKQGLQLLPAKPDSGVEIFRLIYKGQNIDILVPLRQEWDDYRTLMMQAARLTLSLFPDTPISVLGFEFRPPRG